MSYVFDDLPLSPVSEGTTFVVAGPGRLASRLTEKLVLAGRNHDEGMAIVSTNTGGRAIAADSAHAYPSLDTSRLGVIDATGRRDEETDTDAWIGSVSSPADLTGISIQFSRLYSAFVARDIHRIRTCFDSVSMLLMYTNFNTITRFVHTLCGRIDATDGVGFFVVDPSMHDRAVTYTLGNLCDGTIEVRLADGGGAELRVDGVRGQPDEWTAVTL